MNLSAGARLGPYEVVGPLGAGGMGEVWRARDTRLGREVALKFLPGDFADDPERHARFEREAKLLASLNHPNIAVLYGLEHLDGQHALVMELVEGEGLDERIARGPVATEEAIPIALQIADALEAAHEKGIVHRDLKPANVKVRSDGTVKVLDFGLAKAWKEPVPDGDPAQSPTVTGDLTRAGAILGTAAYMSPEQARGKPLDPRADIWAFGCLLYEMLTGRRPFVGDTRAEVLAAILGTDPDWSLLPPDLPRSIRRLLGRCLERDPRQRLRDIGEARIALGRLLAGTEEEQIPPAVQVPSALWRGSWPWMIVIGSGLVLLAGAALIAALSRNPAGTSRELSYVQKTFRRQTIFNARFAPDGKTIVYSAALEGGAIELFVVRPEYPEAQPLGLKDTQLLGVSSQGELAVLSGARFLGHRLFEGTLGRAPLGGGAPRNLMDSVRDADWSPDGTKLAIIHDVGGKDRLEFPVGTVLHESPGYLSEPRVSPTGDRVAFFEHPQRFDDRGSVDVVDLAGERTVVSSGYWGEEGLAWSRNGRTLYFSAATRGGLYQVRSVTLAGRERLVLPTPGSVTLQDASRDGRLLVTMDDHPLRVMVRPPGASEERDLSWLDDSLWPVLSRDGKLLAVRDQGVDGGPNYTVCLRKTDGSPAVRLGDGTGRGFSPDGRWLVATVPSTPQKLMLYPTGTGEARRADRGQLEAYNDAQWLSDGKTLLVSGNEPGHAPRCYVLPLDGGTMRAVTPEGTEHGLISPDARLVCAHLIGGSYRIFPVDGGAPKDVPALTPADTVIRWRPDGKALWVGRTGGTSVRIDSVDVATGSRSALETIESPERSGVLELFGVSLADVPGVYAYTIWQYVSHLFLVEGAV